MTGEQDGHHHKHHSADVGYRPHITSAAVTAPVLQFTIMHVTVVTSASASRLLLLCPSTRPPYAPYNHKPPVAGQLMLSSHLPFRYTKQRTTCRNTQ